MLIPIRCFSCGKVIANKWEEFEKRREKGENVKIILDSIGMNRYCCRRMFLGEVNLIDKLLKYPSKLEIN